jgi:hypothetical protein
MPRDWSTLPLYQKIGIEGPRLSIEYSVYLNKIKAKEIVGATARTAKLVRTFLNPTDFTAADINPAHILKASRGSGLLIDLAHVKTVATAHSAMTRWASELHRSRKPVEFLIEEKITDAVYGVTGNAVDYKFFCFNGEPHFFLCRSNNGENRNFYTLEYEPLKVSGAQLPKIDITEMAAIARTLSAPFPFVRIDLYHAVDGIYFGEFTFHVNAGGREFGTATELELGKLWTVPPGSA